ncbi:MAG: hypothetical protein SFX74_10185 [Fimbriimonadaceae bacterium]|nr:hypothetical protein [Fimbriimonadaceae bacterium]
MRSPWKCGVWSLVVAGLAVSQWGCGGTTEQPVPTTVVFNTTDTAGTFIKITRRNGNADAPGCTLADLPEWCGNPAINEINFDVQPSFTLYRVYVINTSPNDRVCSVRVIRRGFNEIHQKVVPAGVRSWFWEIGIDTIERR